MNFAEYIPQHPLVVPVAVFGFLSCIWIFVITVSSFRQRRTADADGRSRVLRTWINGVETEVTLPISIDLRRSNGRLGVLLRRAGVRVPERAFVSQTAMLLGMSFVVALLWSRSVVIAVAVLAVLATGILFVLRYRAARHRDLMERQCVEALRLSSRSLRAGHPVSGMIQVLAERVQAPTGDLFLEIVQRERMGEPLNEAIRSSLLKAETRELRAFGTALLVQLEAGGNLTDTIDRLCSSIIERMVLRKRGRALTADARFSARVVMLLPFVCVTVFAMNSTRYADFIFWDPVGRLMLVGAIMLILAGLILVNRVARIDIEYEEVAT